MKRMDGDRILANSKIASTLASDSPWYLSSMFVTFTSMKVALLASFAIAFASIVLPQPG